MKTLILDDEYHCRANLKNLISKYCQDIQTILLAETIEEALRLHREHQPDIIFLDISMPEGTGFDFLHQLGKHSSRIVFTTAFSEYAVQAFRYSAVDYLLKPINIQELREAISRCQDETQEKKIEAAEFYLTSQTFDRMLIPTSKGMDFIEFRNILAISAESNYSIIRLISQKEIVVAKTMRNFEELLTKHGFYRIHHSHMINMNYLISFDHKGSEVTLNGDYKVPVSSRKKQAFLQYCQQVLGE